MPNTYPHGVMTSETENAVIAAYSNPMVQVIVGTAPINLIEDPQSAVNVPILCNNITDCRSKLGYSEDYKKFTLCQSMYISFMDMGVGPVVFINVIDPLKHKKSVQNEKAEILASVTKISETGILLNTLVVKQESKNLVLNIDYFVSFDSDGYVNIALDKDIAATNVTVSYDKLDTTMVTNDDIVGAYDTVSEKRTGIELIKDIFPRLQVIPLILTAPAYSKNDVVGAALGAKTEKINGCYTSTCIVDLDTTVSRTRAAAIEEKEERAFSNNTVVCYPCVRKGTKIIALSAVVSALIMKMAVDTEGFTCQSPSNKSINISDCCMEDGTSMFMDEPDGNELNAKGIVTVINRNGFRVWGNNTAMYPVDRRVKNRFIVSRLSMNWLRNNFINNNAELIDQNLSKRLVELIVEDENIKLSSYVAKGYILGGEISYHESENSSETIMNGHFKFNTKTSPNIPMESIENEYIVDVEEIRSAILGGGDE